MNIDKLNFHCMWFETEDGQVVIFDPATDDMPPVETHPIAVSRFPREVRTEYYRRRDTDGGYGGNDRIFAGTASFPESLVIALATGANGQRKFSLSDAMIIASENCERCMNALAHQYGLEWGYPEFEEEWQRCRTECKMCKED